MAQYDRSTRGVMPFILGAVVIAIGALVWYLVASDGNTFGRSSPTSAPVTIEMQQAPAPAQDPAPAPADPEPPAPADPTPPAPTGN